MRIATYYPDIRQGRNDGGPLYVNYNLRKIFGDNVMHIWPHKGDMSIYGKFDLHIWVDYGEDGLGRGETEIVCPKPNVYWTSDTHLGYEYRLKKAREFDWVFCSQEKAVQDFVKDGIEPNRCFWLPHAFDPLAYSPGIFNAKENSWNTQAVSIKKYDVCFIGNLNDANRVDHLDRLFKEFSNFHWSTKRFHEAAEKYNQSKIVFNVSSRGELNMRHFEALGTGSLLLTDRLPIGQNVFKEDVHFVGYGNMDEMIEKARYYIDPEHEAEGQKIAQAGYEAAIAHHTYMHRVMTILDTVGIEYDKEKAMEHLPKISNELVTA